VRGSTIALSDSGGTVSDEYAYDPFGKLANSNGTSENVFKYLGQFGVADEGSGLAYAKARCFSPELGRFVTKDPLTGKDGDSQSLNRYVYALNNPILLSDPIGLSGWRTAATASGQLASGFVGLGLALLPGSAGTVKSARTGNPVYFVNGFLSTLDAVNEATRSIGAGSENLARALFGREAISIDSSQGVFDEWLEMTQRAYCEMQIVC